MAERGIRLASFDTRDETLRFIHDDFYTRYERLVAGKEIQSWRDPDLTRNIEMWAFNYVSHITSQPYYISSKLSKMILLGTRMTINAFLADLGGEDLEREAEHARESARGSELKNIAEIAEDRARSIPLDLMKEEAVEHWVSIASPQAPLLEAPLPVCHDLKGHIRKRLVDIIGGYPPAMVRQYVCDSAHSHIMAREHHGMQILMVDDHCAKRYVTYAPSRAATKQAGLPVSLKMLFSEKEGQIACIEKRRIGDPVASHEHIFHKPPHDSEYHFVSYFVEI